MRHIAIIVPTYALRYVQTRTRSREGYVELACILSKEADVTVAFRVTLPELFTVTSAEYEAMHSCWVKALKILPPHTVVHKQDWVRHDIM